MPRGKESRTQSFYSQFEPNQSFWAQSVIIPNFYVESIDTREKFGDFL